MTVRRPWKLLAGIATGVLGLSASWLVGLGDSRWWQLVPWVLLAALWTAVLAHGRRQRLADAAEAQAEINAPAS